MEQDNNKSATIKDEPFPIFKSAFAFARESTGVTVTLAYLTMILSSTAYLFVLYSAFDINILKFTTIEDILSAPIKNPDIILVFGLLGLLLYLVDITNFYSIKQREKYRDKKMPAWLKIFLVVFWVPESRKKQMWFIILSHIVSLMAYIFVFASLEAENIKNGVGEKVEIQIVDKAPFEATLLGAFNYYLFTFDHQTKQSMIYYVEALESIKPLPVATQSPKKSEELDANEDSE